MVAPNTNTLVVLTERGFVVRAVDDHLIVWPVSRLTPADRELIRDHRAELLAALTAPPPTHCPACQRSADRGRCWFCHWRVCSVCRQRDTGSAFLSTCLICDLRCEPIE
jgi:hypothetical protein